MLLLVSGATRTARSEHVGHLIVPSAWNKPESLGLVPGKWAMDNGAFSRFDGDAFMAMLEIFRPYPGCLFVAAPDVIRDAARTRRQWAFWRDVIHGVGLPAAFVAQDGLQLDQMPWDECEALFVGGTTDYKESQDVRTLCAYAKARGKFVHWGRVNGKRRYELALKAGCDSIDGTGFSMYPDTNIPKVDEWNTAIQRQPELGL